MASVVMEQIAPFVDCAALLNDPVALNKHAQTLGYVYVRGLLSAERLLALRETVLSYLADADLLDPAAPLAAGIARAGAELLDGTPQWRTFYARVYRTREFHAIAHDPALLALLNGLFPGRVFVHPRHILRSVFPGRLAFTTPPHQDVWYIHGTENTWTTWLPLGDCPAELGGLAILPGSHHQGRQPMRKGQGAGGQEVDADLSRDHEWHTGPLACGDVLIFHSLTIHQGCDNRTSDRIRLSLDLRFQSCDEPIHASSLAPHMAILPWEDIYAGWPADDPLRYYWRSVALTVQA